MSEFIEEKAEKFSHYAMEQYGFQEGAKWYQQYSIKIIKDKLNYYQNKGVKSKTEENKDFAIINELNLILKLLNNG